MKAYGGLKLKPSFAEVMKFRAFSRFESGNERKKYRQKKREEHHQKPECSGSGKKIRVFSRHAGKRQTLRAGALSVMRVFAGAAVFIVNFEKMFMDAAVVPSDERTEQECEN